MDHRLFPSRTFFLIAASLSVLAFGNSALAVAPTAPTGFSMPKMTYHSGGSTGTQVWRVQWTDKSTDEDGFRIYFRYGGPTGPTQAYQDVPTATALTSVVTTNGSKTVTCTSTGHLDVGWSVSGTNIAANTIVESITNSTTFVLSTAATGSGSGLTLAAKSVYQAGANYTYAMNMGVRSDYFPGFYMEWWVAAYKGYPPTEISTASNIATFGSWPGAASVNASPTAPSNLTATAGGDGFFHITWSDNSNSEYGFQLDYKKSSDSTWLATGIDFGETAQDVGGYKTRTLATDMFQPNFLPGTSYDFRMRAVDWANNVSAYTSTVTATSQAFKAPTSLTATRVGESTFNLSFVNNSTAESGYHFQYRAQGTATWSDLGNVDDPFFNTTPTPALPPGTNYEFQVRAYIRNTNSPSDTPVTYSAFSNIATASSLFIAPTGLTATSPGEGLVNLSWTDNSTSEGNYEVQVRIKGTTQWQSYDYLAANTTSLTNQLIAPGETLEFQVRATYGAQAEITSAFSNIAEVTPAFNAPTNLVATPSPTEPNRISFTWTDNSSVETEYELQYRKQGGTFAIRKIIGANVGTAPNSMSLPNLPEFDPGSIYEFQIRARLSSSDGSVISASAYSSIATATTKDGFSSKPYAPITMGTPFSYQMSTISQHSRTDWSVGTLPGGLTFDNATGVISGTPTVAGLFTVPMTANFNGGGSHVLNLALRILRPPSAPQITAAISDQTITAGSNVTIGLNSKFSDLDTDSGVRMSTTLGNVDIVMYSTLTPGTVANFQSYDYTGTIFHRAPAGFVIQGGGYTIYEAPNVFESLARQAAVANEPGISNLYGTVAMAKVGDDPDSATSEFFISLGNNSANLDNQNGGFTVFGRVASGSLAVLSALGSVSTTNYNVKLRQDGVTPDSANMTFTNIPINETPVPSSIDQAKLLKVNSITGLPVLSYAITASPDSAVASAVVNGTDLQITAEAPGSTFLEITATDLDGNVTSQTVNILVPKLPATITLEDLAQTYDGNPKTVTATTNPAGLAVSITYNGDTTAPSDHGAYNIVGTITDSVYAGTQNGVLVIGGQSVSDWRAQRFSPAQITDGLAADNADPDGDGLSNLAEYALGTNPLGHTNALTPVRDANGFTLTFTRPKSLPDVTYGAESTDDLGIWSPLPLEVVTDGPVQTIRVNDPLTSGNPTRRFIRLSFGAPIPP